METIILRVLCLRLIGGTNAHAIVESFDSPSSGMSPDGRPYTPFVFSASTEYSLRETLLSFLAFFEGTGSDVNLQDLAWTLRQRRSALPCRTSFNASSIDELRQSIAARLEGKENQNIGIKSISTQAATGQSSRRILGVFTGQGAQYPRMGAELIEASSIARSVIQKLESYLAAIPNKNDRPSWSLETELLADATSSRINEALLSQPLCTAVQILLVDLLKIAGVEFAAVIGHSSGEIAAAYAAGYLSAKDASKMPHLTSYLTTRSAYSLSCMNNEN
jgi:acyl transferase domain-containing protein